MDTSKPWRMEVDSSVRYQEAVIRLKKLLYEDPPPLPSTSYSSLGDQTTAPLHSDYHHRTSYVESTHNLRNRSRAWDGVGADGSSATDGVEGKGSRTEGVARWLLELLHHQEDLIVQLEKENEFLKREVVTVSDGVRKMAEDNQDLHRRLANALSQALAQDETSESHSISDGSQADKKAESTPRLQSRENELLAAEVERLQSTLEATTEREHQALDKLRKALSIAEDTQALTAQVRASSESAVEELSGLLAATKQEEEKLKLLLTETDQKVKEQMNQQEQWKTQQQQRVKLLEDEISDQSTVVNQLESDVREKTRKIAALKDDLQVSQAAKARMETQLEEQRRHSKDAHTRLDHIIMTRSAEAASATTRARDLEDRLSSARQDINRLLHTITTMAQGSGRPVETDTTDDVKSERLAAEQQLSSVLSALQNRHEEEVRSLQAAAIQHKEAMDALREEVTSMRQQLIEENDKHRECLQEMQRGLRALTSPTAGDKKDGDQMQPATSTRTVDIDSGLASAKSITEGVNGNGDIQDNTVKGGKDSVSPESDKEKDISAKESQEKTNKKTSEGDDSEEVGLSLQKDKIATGKDDIKNKSVITKQNDKHSDSDDSETKKQITDSDSTVNVNEEIGKKKEKTENKDGDMQDNENDVKSTPGNNENTTDTSIHDSNDVSLVHPKKDTSDDGLEPIKKDANKDPSKKDAGPSKNNTSDKASLEPPKKDSRDTNLDPKKDTSADASLDPPKKEVGDDASLEPPKEEVSGDASLELPKKDASGANLEPKKDTSADASLEPSKKDASDANLEPKKDTSADSSLGPSKKDVSDDTSLEPSKKDASDDASSEHPKKDAGDDVSVEPKKKGQCETCDGWSVIVDVVGQAMEELQVDVEKQGTRLHRMMNTHSSQCNNCLKYQLFLGATSYRLDKLDKYSDMLGKRIDSLTYRVMSW